MTPRPAHTFAALGFATTHDALAAEASLKAAGVPAVPIPTPRELGSLCGIALRLELADVAAAESELAARGISWTARAEFEDV